MGSNAAWHGECACPTVQSNRERTMADDSVYFASVLHSARYSSIDISAFCARAYWLMKLSAIFMWDSKALLAVNSHYAGAPPGRPANSGPFRGQFPDLCRSTLGQPHDPPVVKPVGDLVEVRQPVLDIDLEHCPQCGGEFKIIAAIEEPAVIVRILTHLGLPARAPPRSPAQQLPLFQAA